MSAPSRQDEGAVKEAGGEPLTGRARIEAHVTRFSAPVDARVTAPVWAVEGVDLLLVKAAAERPFHLFVTSGLSERPMKAPKSQWQHAELCLLLPPAWPLDFLSGEKTQHAWPVSGLASVARLPFLQDSWLGFGHSIPNGQPPAPLGPGTALSAWLLIPPVSLPEKFTGLQTKRQPFVNFWALVPLHEDEMAFKLKKGTDKLLALFGRKGIQDILDPGRPSVLVKRSTGGLWRLRGDG